MWMQQLIADFGTDHWYQLDGYFNGGTAPWMQLKQQQSAQGHKGTPSSSSTSTLASSSSSSSSPINYPPPPHSGTQRQHPIPVDPANPPCVWAAPVAPALLNGGCVGQCVPFVALADAQVRTCWGCQSERSGQSLTQIIAHAELLRTCFLSQIYSFSTAKTRILDSSISVFFAMLATETSKIQRHHSALNVFLPP
jgi:hypothetical protein